MGGQKGIAAFYTFLSALLPVTLVSTKNNESPDNLKAEFLPVLSNSKLRYINPFLFFSIRKIIREKKSTHLLIEHPYYGWLGILLQLFCRVKLVVHSHNIEATRFKSTGKWWWGILWNYEKWVHQMAAINFFITDEDRSFAIERYKLKPHLCHTVTYGFEMNSPPAPEEKPAARKSLEEKFQISPEQRIILFNGTLDYPPNLEAVIAIKDQINPLLMAEKNFNYTIIICGKNLPGKYNELVSERKHHIIYAGFVDDISLYFKAADMFINPVKDGGGIKTKLVEALGYDLCCISTTNGAIGVPVGITGNKMTVVDNNDWENFADAIIKTDPNKGRIGQAFYTHFYWGNIAEKAAAIIKASSHPKQQ